MNVLVIRGGREKLREMGFEAPLEEADLIIDVAEESARDRWGQTYRVQSIDADPIAFVLLECMERIKAAWEQAYPDDAHLSHAAAGMWVSYWFSPEMETVGELVRQGRQNDLRAAAADFIDAGFGEHRGPTLNQPVLSEA